MATPKKMGRPTRYNENITAQICEGIAQGKSLRTVCLAEEMPYVRTVFLWLAKQDKNGDYMYPKFIQQYARATEERSEALIEETLDIADNGRNDWMEQRGLNITNREAIERSKLRIDTRKWMASKLKPKKYGDKLDVTSGGEKLPTPITTLPLKELQ